LFRGRARQGSSGIRDSEVQKLYLPRRGDQDSPRRDVTVDERLPTHIPARVGVGERLEDFLADEEHQQWAEQLSIAFLRSPNYRLQVAAQDVLFGEEVFLACLPELVDGHQVGVDQARAAASGIDELRDHLRLLRQLGVKPFNHQQSAKSFRSAQDREIGSEAASLPQALEEQIATELFSTRLVSDCDGNDGERRRRKARGSWPEVGNSLDRLRERPE